MPAYENKIKERLGEENYNTVLEWCDNNSITKDLLVELSSKLGEKKRVYGRLAQTKYSSTRQACREMFSYWYQMFPGEVTLEKLVEALEDDDVCLTALAYEISPKTRKHPIKSNPIQISEKFKNPPSQDCDFSVAQHVSTVAKKLGMSWADKVNKKGAGERKGLMVSNTYTFINNEQLDSLPGCDASATAMKDAFEHLQNNAGKTPILCTMKKDRSKDTLMTDVENFTKKCNQDHVDTLVFYFAGHGGHEALEISSDAAKADDIVGNDGCEVGNKYYLGNLASVKEGGNFIYGDPDNKGNCGKIYNHHLISSICKATPNVSHRIIIFDSCRGDKKKEMAKPQTQQQVTVNFSDLQKLQNADYKNTYVFHSTLPHQVAWCEEGGNGLTNFSKYFTKFVGHVDLSCMDIAINAALKYEAEEKGKGHVQMVELVKWADTPFQF